MKIKKLLEELGKTRIIYFKDNDGETKDILFVDNNEVEMHGEYLGHAENNKEIMDVLFKHFENICGGMPYPTVVDSDGYELYSDGQRWD